MKKEEFHISSTQKGYPNKKHWQFCVGSGHALLALRTDYTRQLKFIHDTLGIRYVRFHGIFDDDMSTVNTLAVQMPVPGAERFREFNFRACGIAYDNVLSAGMKPFVELSFMPRELAEDPEKTGSFYYRPIDCMPKDLTAWRDYIQRFIRFLEHRYGEAEVRTWYFEVWNEPDLNPVFFQGIRDDYFRLYEATARAIKEVDPYLSVGGPATSGSKWVKSFRNFCEEKNVPLDFISTHQYAGDPLGGVEDQGDPNEDGDELMKGLAGGEEGYRRFLESMAGALQELPDGTFLDGFRAMMPDKSETTDIPNDVFIRNSAIVRQQAGTYPLFYTEWNENAGFSSWTNDTRKVAAYDVKTALDVAENVDGSSIWCFSDIFEELHPFVQPFHGGFGMLSQDGIPKPVYYALRMLAQTGCERIDLGPKATKGEIGIAAFRDGAEVQVLLFRQKMKNDEAAEKIPVKVRVDFPRKPVLVTAERVDADHGNPLRIWQEMGARDDLNQKEIREIIEKSKVVPEPWTSAYEDGAVSFGAELGVNDVYFFRIR